MKSKIKAKIKAKNTTKKKTTMKTATPPKALPAGLHKKQGVWVFSTGTTHHGPTDGKTPVNRYIVNEKIDGWET